MDKIPQIQKDTLRILGVPQHVAIIMDGNGRWAVRRGLPRIEGHRAGMKNIRPTVERCIEFGIPILTLYVFSTENWRRSLDEIRSLMGLVEEFYSEVQTLHEQGVRVLLAGSIEEAEHKLSSMGLRLLGRRVRQRLVEAVELTKDNDHFTLNFAFNYGGRAEILRAVRQAIADRVEPSSLIGVAGEEIIGRYMYTAGLPDPDLIIRTAGEKRLSNFLLWQAAYSEFYFSPVLWPDFDADELFRALVEYNLRERRWGGRPREG